MPLQGARGREARAPHRESPIDAKTLALTAAQLADDKKALDVEVIHVTEQLKVADYFVVATGQNRNHVRAIYDELHVRLKRAGEKHRPVEGAGLGWWIVMDYGDVVVHLFQDEARTYYDLDHLFGECPRVDWKSAEVPALPDSTPGEASA